MTIVKLVNKYQNTPLHISASLLDFYNINIQAVAEEVEQVC